MRVFFEKIRYAFFRFPFLLYLLLFLLYFSLEYLLIGSPWFPTDELDIMIAGRDMVDGYQLYTDYSSQHMPFSYYMSAFFASLGARTVSLQRICFFLFYALMWTLMVFFYGKTEKKRAVALFPILFIFVSCSYDFGPAILSEQIAGIGFSFLFLEFLQFYRTHELRLRNYIIISWSVLLTFGTMFISAFGLFVIAVAVLILEIYWEIRKKESFIRWLLRMIKRYLLLVVSILIPWVIMVIYYAANNMLGMVFFSAYTYNRDIYSKYNGSFGSDIGAAVRDGFLSIFRNLSLDVKTLMNPESKIDFARAGFFIMLFILLICFLIFAAIRISLFVSVISFLFLVALSVRGVMFQNSFHSGTPYMILCLFAALFFGNAVFVRWKRKKAFAALLRVASILSIAYMAVFYVRLADFDAPTYKEGDIAAAEAIAALTDKGEPVWINTFMLDLDMNADRPMIWNIGITPWGWEAMSDDVFPLLRETPPRVIVFNPGHTVWVYSMDEYAPELIDFVDENYKNLHSKYIKAYTPETALSISEDYGEYPSYIYVRNDYYDEAVKKLEAGK
ncbi:MAG: hypothetical protein IJI65_10850 [Lachnospiraceae bacterium]|nr:hypothetical protein [Lachnospiraceae bacterium]